MEQVRSCVEVNDKSSNHHSHKWRRERKWFRSFVLFNFLRFLKWQTVEWMWCEVFETVQKECQHVFNKQPAFQWWKHWLRSCMWFSAVCRLSSNIKKSAYMCCLQGCELEMNRSICFTTWLDTLFWLNHIELHFNIQILRHFPNPKFECCGRSSFHSDSNEVNSNAIWEMKCHNRTREQ